MIITPRPIFRHQTTQVPDSTTRSTPPPPETGVGAALSRETLCPGRPDLLERLEGKFWGRVRVGDSEECWPWQGPVGKKNGYGVFSFWNGEKSRIVGVHRLAYALAVGSIPAGLLVCHACDVRTCCNPAHLWVGTYKDNGRDMARKGRDAMAKLDPEKVRSIRARYAAGGVTQKELAEEHGVASAHVSGVISGLFWAHVS